MAQWVQHGEAAKLKPKPGMLAHTQNPRIQICPKERNKIKHQTYSETQRFAEFSLSNDHSDKI